MATIVNLPQHEGIGTGLGRGMSMGLMKAFEKRERQERVQKVQQAFEGIRSASERGGRAAALEAANVALGLAEDPADVKTILGYVDQVAPQENFQQVPIVDQENNPSLAFVPSTKLGQLNTPEGRQSLLPQGTKIGRPEDEFEYVRPPAEEGGTPQFVGKGPMSKKPEGAVPLKEFEIARQLEADRRAAQRESRLEQREDRMETAQQQQFQFQRESAARAERSANRQAAAAERAAGNQSADNFRADANRARQALMALGGKQLSDGSFALVGDNDKKLFSQRLPYVERRLEEEYRKQGSKGGVVNVGSIIDEAIQKFPGGESKEEEELPPPPSTGKAKGNTGPGIMERLNETARGINQSLGISDIPRIRGQEDYDKLPPGATFIGPDGKRYKKPGKK